MKIKNPKLTLTVGDNVTGLAYVLDDNNEFVGIGIESNKTYETVALRIYDDDIEKYLFLGAAFEQVVGIFNAVNCTLRDGAILITDPTKDASCTVNAVNIFEPIDV